MMSTWSRDRREIVAGAAILFAIITGAYFPFTYGDRTLMSSAQDAASLYTTGGLPSSPARGVIAKGLDPGAAAWQTEPELFLIHDQIATEHTFPLWNPYVGYGEPLAGNIISQPLYPLTWLVFADPSVRAYDWFIVLRFFVAAFFTFLYMRLFVRFVAALAAGVGFAFTGYLLLYFNIPHLSVECFIPAVIWAMELFLRKGGAGGVVRLALVLAITVFGGMPESALLCFLFAYGYVLFRMASDPRQRPAWRATGVRLAIASVLGAGMSACILLPFAEFVRLSVNQHEARLTGSVTGLGSDTFSLEHVAGYLTPLVYGPPWSGIFDDLNGQQAHRGFFGVAQTFFALIAFGSLASRLRHRTFAALPPELYFATVAVLVFLKHFGSPLVNWIGALPGLSLVIFPKYEEPIVGFCVAALSGFGIERLAARSVSPRSVWTATALILGLVTAVANTIKPRLPEVSADRSVFFGSLFYSLVVLAFVSGTSWFAVRRARVRYEARLPLLLSFALLFEALTAYFIPVWYIDNDEPAISVAPIAGNAYTRFVAQQTSASHERFFGEGNLLYPEWSSAFKISDPRDLNPLYNFRYIPFLQAFLPAGPYTELTDRFTGALALDFTDPLTLRFLELSSVAYVGSPSPIQASRLELAYSDPTISIYHVRNTLPRLAVYACVDVANDDAGALKLLAAPAFDPHAEAVVTAGANEEGRAHAGMRGSTCAVRAGTIERYTSRDIRGSTFSSDPSLIVLNDTTYPGWVGYVDGAEATTVTADYMFRGLYVPAGRHAIEFKYEPRSFDVGLTISILSVLLGVAYPFYAGRRSGGTANAPERREATSG